MKLWVLPAAAPWGQLHRGALRPANSWAEAPGFYRWTKGGGLRMGEGALQVSDKGHRTRWRAGVMAAPMGAVP